MTVFQKQKILAEIRRLEDLIDDTKKVINNDVERAEDWNGAETVASFVTRLNGYISERRGIFTALTIMGCEMTWKEGTNKLGTIKWGDE